MRLRKSSERDYVEEKKSGLESEDRGQFSRIPNATWSCGRNIIRYPPSESIITSERFSLNLNRTFYRMN